MTDETLETAIADGPQNGTTRDAGPDASTDERQPIELTETALEALLFVAERPLSRREIAALAGTDRATVDERLGDLEVALRERGVRLLIDGDRVELATAPEAGALVARYVGADAVRLSPASPRDAGDRRLPAARHEGRRSSASAASTPTTPFARCSTVGWSSSSAGPTRPDGRSCTAPASSSSSGSASTSLEELPPLDVDVAARLAEEGGGARHGARCSPGSDGEPRAPDVAAERLQKVLAAAGVASRRAAEAMIAAGRVTVDGKKATLGTQVDPDRQIIAVDGRVIGSARRRRPTSCCTSPPA